MRTLLASSAVVLAILFTGTPAAAEIIERSGTFGGLHLTYKVALPAGYDASRTYPAVLVFTGGPQLLRMAEGTVNSDWRAEAERRGYVVISPGTPNGSLFFQDADRVFPEFLEHVIREFKIRGGKMHVAGHSNGGISAFHVAARHPKYFLTVTGYPGLLDGPDERLGAAIKPLCIFMHVGDRDAGWRGAMEAQAATLKKQGYRIALTVEPNQVHRLRAGEISLSPRLFDQIESCR